MADITEIPTVLSPIQAITAKTGFETVFHVAARVNGDATLWDRVMALNPTLINADGFWEYDLSTVPTITVPPVGSVTSTGGIMQSFPVPQGQGAHDFNSDFDFRFD